MLSRLQKQRGASLIELMIAMALGLGSLSLMASVIAYGIATNGKLLANARLSEEVNAIGVLISRDLKRAGYNGNTPALVAKPNVFPSAFANSLVVSQHPDESASTCIVFAYDRNRNGVLDTVGTNENYGFRLHDGAVEIRMAGADCSQGKWQNLSDTRVVVISELRFSLNQTTFNGAISSQIELFLAAKLATDHRFSRQYRTRFLVRNYD